MAADAAARDWPIQEIARLAGTTSRTLRHYDAIGLLAPSRIGGNGYRYYDQDSLVRLQRILLLRDLGLGLPVIGDVLDNQTDQEEALRGHLHWLREERKRLARQIASVELTVMAREGGEQLMAEDMLDGFDHTQYEDEVSERWGADAYSRGDLWWRALTAEQKNEFQQRLKALSSDWSRAAASGLAPDSAEGQALAQRHFEWLRGIPGTPQAASGGPAKEYFVGLGEMYVADPRFGQNYGGQHGAEFVRDALAVYAERNL